MRSNPRVAVVLFCMALALIAGRGVFFTGNLALGAESAETIKIRVQGFGKGEGRVGRSAALNAAEEEAVGLLIAQLVPEQWWPYLEPIEAQLHSYVRTARPVKVQQFRDGVEVDAEVYIYENQLRQDVAAIVFRNLPRPPVTALVVAEESAGVQDWSVGQNGFGESHLRDKLQQAGFNVLERAAVKERYPDEELMRVHSGGVAELSMFGRDVGADLVIQADVIVQARETNAANLSRYHAEVEVDLVRPADQVKVYRAESEALVDSHDAAMGGRQSTEDALDKVLRPLLVEAVLAMATRPMESHYTLSVTLPTDGPWLSRVRRGIRDRLPDARLKDMRHVPGRARFSLEFGGELGDIVHALVDEPFDRFRLEPARAAGFELELDLLVDDQAKK